MTLRTRAALAAISAGVVALAAACGPVQEPPPPIAPDNSCPAHPCTAYHQATAPSCDATGACAVPVPPGALVLEITLAEDSGFAPSTQYVVPYEHLADCRSDQQEVCDPTCVWPGCGHLPAPALVLGGYLMSLCVQSIPSQCGGGLSFFLGNVTSVGGIADTLLPVHSTYRLLKSQWGTDVASLGLPVQPVVAAQIINPGPNPGPNGGPSYAWELALPLGTYDRTIAPDPPYDAVFGPAVGSDTITGSQFESISVQEFDVTTRIMGLPMNLANTPLPTFDISSAQDSAGHDFPLDGWTAFLRDTTTLRPLSNVRALSGTDNAGVQLVTNHGQPDALIGAELVMVPPSRAPYPTAVYPLQGSGASAEIPYSLKYPSLAPYAQAAVTVLGAGGAPIDADVVFEGQAFAEPLATFNTTFEFTGVASPRPNEGRLSGNLDLPQGVYRVDIIPRDGVSAQSIQTLEVLGEHPEIELQLGPQPTVRGRAKLTDGRDLAGAVVEGLPVSCAAASPPAGDAGPLLKLLKTLGTTPSCLPRPTQTSTGADGSFSLPADPGGYTLRVRPAAGTALPWATQALSVSGDTQVGEVSVPAPFHASFKLVDPSNSPVVHALVKAFLSATSPSAPAAPGAVELGEALTDSTGQCDLYMALPQ